MKKILLLLSNGFEAYEAACFTDVTGFAKRELDIDIESTGIHKKLQCAYGFSVIPNKILNEIDLDNYDALAIPGGNSGSGFYIDAYKDQFLDIIRAFNSLERPIAGICTGSIVIAKSGILTGRKGTTFPGKRQIEMGKYGVSVENNDIVIDNNVITSSSPKTGITVAFKLLEMIYPDKQLENIKSLFI